MSEESFGAVEERALDLGVLEEVNSQTLQREPSAPTAPQDPEAIFQLSRNWHSEMVEEELDIIIRLSDAVTERLGPNASEAEREAAAEAIWAEDPELLALADRLSELIAANPKSIARGLGELAQMEEEQKER